METSNRKLVARRHESLSKPKGENYEIRFSPFCEQAKAKLFQM